VSSTRVEESAAPFDVVADLTLTVEGQPIAVESYTDLVVVDLPSVRVLRPLWQGAGSRLDAVDRTLRTTDLTVEVRIDGTPVARLGADARPQVGPVQILVAGALRAAVEAPIRFFS
jgi:hypothetical protein